MVTQQKQDDVKEGAMMIDDGICTNDGEVINSKGRRVDTGLNYIKSFRL